jgi:hypothetical protein
VAQLDERLATAPGNLDADVRALRAAAGVAPVEVAPDVATLADAVAALAEESRARPEDRVAGLRAGMSRLEPSAPTLETSSDRVVAWAGEHCGLRLGAETAGGVTASRPDAR